MSQMGEMEAAFALLQVRLEESVASLKSRLDLRSRRFGVLKSVADLLLTGDPEMDVLLGIPPLVREVEGVEPIVYAQLAKSRRSNAWSYALEELGEASTALHAEYDIRGSVVCIELRDVPPDSPLHALREGCQEGATLAVSSIFHGDEEFGFLALPVTDAAQVNEDVRNFIESLCETIGTFVGNIELRRGFSDSMEELSQNFVELMAVHEVAGAIGENMELETLLECALDAILDHDVFQLQAEGGVFLVNEEEHRLDLACFRGTSDYIPRYETSIPLGYCLCGQAVQSGEIVISENCLTDERHHQYEGIEAHGHINLPLAVGDKVLGVLFLYLPPGVKPQPSQIRMLTAIAGRLAMAIENAGLYEEVRFRSLHDPLTKLVNRASMQDALDGELDRAIRYRSYFSIAMMDLDDFKKINDTYGHQVGDAVLRSTAGVIIGALRGCDTVARFGGEEFLVLLPETDLIRCEATMGRLRQLIEANEVVVDESGPVRVTVSIGIAAFDPDYPVGLPSLIGSADEALYRAKNQGKNRLVVARDAAHATASGRPSQT